ncbi:hypothetical protein ACQPTN_40580 [Bradyrhizobium sp. 13971]
MAFRAIESPLRRFRGRLDVIGRRHGAVEDALDRLLGTGQVVELCAGTDSRSRQLLVDRPETVIGLKIDRIELAKSLKGLFRAAKRLDLELRIADNPQPAAAPFEAAHFLREEAQVAGTRRPSCDRDVLLEIKWHDHQGRAIVRHQARQQLEDRAILDGGGQRRP